MRIIEFTYMGERGQVLLIALGYSSPLLIHCLTYAKDSFAAEQITIIVSSLDSPYYSFAQSLQFLWHCPFFPSCLWSSDSQYVSALYSGSSGFRVAILAPEIMQTISKTEGWGSIGNVVLAEMHYRNRKGRVLRQYQDVEAFSTFLVSLRHSDPLRDFSLILCTEEPCAKSIDAKWDQKIRTANSKFKCLLSQATSTLPCPFPPLSHIALSSLTHYIQNALFPSLVPPALLLTLSSLLTSLHTEFFQLQQVLVQALSLVTKVEQRVREMREIGMKVIAEASRRGEGLRINMQQGREWLRREIRAKEEKIKRLFELSAVEITKDAALVVQVTPIKQYKVPCKLVISTDSEADRVIPLATAVARKVKLGHLSEFQADIYQIKIIGENGQQSSNLLTISLSLPSPQNPCFLSSHIGNLSELEHHLLNTGGLQALLCFRSLAERWTRPEMRLVERLVEAATQGNGAQARLEAMGFEFDISN